MKPTSEFNKKLNIKIVDSKILAVDPQISKDTNNNHLNSFGGSVPLLTILLQVGHVNFRPTPDAISSNRYFILPVHVNLIYGCFCGAGYGRGAC